MALKPGVCVISVADMLAFKTEHRELGQSSDFRIIAEFRLIRTWHADDLLTDSAAIEMSTALWTTETAVGSCCLERAAHIRNGPTCSRSLLASSGIWGVVDCVRITIETSDGDLTDWRRNDWFTITATAFLRCPEMKVNSPDELPVLVQVTLVSFGDCREAIIGDVSWIAESHDETWSLMI